MLTPFLLLKIPLASSGIDTRLTFEASNTTTSLTTPISSMLITESWPAASSSFRLALSKKDVSLCLIKGFFISSLYAPTLVVVRPIGYAEASPGISVKYIPSLSFGTSSNSVEPLYQVAFSSLSTIRFILSSKYVLLTLSLSSLLMTGSLHASSGETPFFSSASNLATSAFSISLRLLGMLRRFSGIASIRLLSTLSLSGTTSGVGGASAGETGLGPRPRIYSASLVPIKATCLRLGDTTYLGSPALSVEPILLSILDISG